MKNKRVLRATAVLLGMVTRLLTVALAGLQVVSDSAAVAVLGCIVLVHIVHVPEDRRLQRGRPSASSCPAIPVQTFCPQSRGRWCPQS